MARKRKYLQFRETETFDLEYKSLDEAINILKEMRERLGTGEGCIEYAHRYGYYDEVDTELEFNYYRQETDAEYEKRMEHNREQREKRKQEKLKREEREREELRKLLKKYPEEAA